MKEYELTVVVHPDLEADIEMPLKKVRELIAANGGKILREDNWGKKKLAYSVKKQEFGVYIYMEVNLPAEAPLKISSALNISDEILRYLLAKVDEKGRKALAEAAKAAAEKSEATDNKVEE